MYELFLSYYDADGDVVGYDVFDNQPELSSADLHMRKVEAPANSVVCVASLVESDATVIVWVEVFLMGEYYGEE